MIVFVSNFASPHSIPLAEELYSSIGDKFIFIETKEITSERINLGYDTLSNKPFVIKYNQFTACRQKYISLIQEADTVLVSYGSIDTALIDARIKNDKLTFLMSERIFKKGLIKLFDPKFLKTLLFIHRIRKKNFHLLCMGAYVSRDYSICGFSREKMWKFGYITMNSSSNIKKIMNKKPQNEIQILWVGRLIWWKKPFDAIKAVNQLLKKGFNIKLKIIGDGNLKSRLINCINENQIDNRIQYYGSISNLEVRELMEQSNILLCTSNRLEGWGAVINEGMSSGCLVIANDKMGAAPYLISNELTGLLYHGGHKELRTSIERAISKLNVSEIAFNGFQNINSYWNARIAAMRLLNLIEAISSKKEKPLYKGICENISIRQ